MIFTKMKDKLKNLELKNQINLDMISEMNKEKENLNNRISKYMEESKSTKSELDYYKKGYKNLLSDIDGYKKALADNLIKILSSLDECNISKLYEEFRYLDDKGWLELDVVSNIIPCNIYSEFYYEDNTGVFDAIETGYGMIPWYEKAEFGKFEYNFVSSMYEQGTCTNKYWELPKYEEYRKKVEKQLLEKLCKSNPLEFKNTLDGYNKLDGNMCS